MKNVAALEAFIRDRLPAACAGPQRRTFLVDRTILGLNRFRDCAADHATVAGHSAHETYAVDTLHASMLAPRPVGRLKRPIQADDALSILGKVERQRIRQMRKRRSP